MKLSRAILTIHSMIRNTLLAIPVIAILILYFLQSGITIDLLHIGNFKITNMYLKLDKKFTLKIDELIIPKEHDTETLHSIDESIKGVKRLFSYFEYIELKALRYTNDSYHIIYEDEIIYVDNSVYEIAGMISPQDGGLVASLPLIYLKKYKLTLQGEASYAYDSGKVTFDGEYSIQNLNGVIKADMLRHKLRFWIDSNETDNISKVLDTFNIPDKTRVWIDKRVQAKRYKISEFRGVAEVDKDSFILDIKETTAKITLSDAKIIFHKKLDPVVCKTLNIKLNKSRLDFELLSPKYKQKDMSGSQVSLLGLSKDKDLRLLVKLKFDTRYDKDIAGILGAYGIKIPINQYKGNVKATVDLDVNLNTKKTQTKGRILISKGIIHIGKAKLKTDGAEVTFTQNRVALWDTDIHDKWYRGTLNGYINLDSKKAKFKTRLKYLNIGDKDGIHLNIREKKLNILLDYNKGVRFDIPVYNLKISTAKNSSLKIKSSSIKPLLRYIKGLPIKVSQGSLSATASRDKKYDFAGNAIWKSSYIRNKRGKYLQKINFYGRYTKSGTIINILNNKFIYNSKKSLLKIKNVDIDVKKMISIHSPTKKKKSSKLTVQGSNCNIKYGKYKLLTDTINLQTRGKKINFTAYKDGDRVKITSDGSNLSITATKIKNKMLRALINFDGLKGGRYSLRLTGKIGKSLKGVVDIEGGSIKKFKAYNDLIALFNTIPALMTLSNPGFSSKGYSIKDGQIIFRIIGDRVIFDKIYINGKSSTISGKGYVQISNGKMNIDLAVRTAREIGKVLGSLPLVGYILFGKDKSITTGLKIVGTMDKPKVKVNPVKEALLYPFELLKRTLQSPAHIINN